MASIFDFDFQLILSHLLRIAAAYLLALPIAWNREREFRGAGLRTFPLVAVASCGYVMVGISVLGDSGEHARILYGLMTGIGFIGGGAILKNKQSVRGTATAASIWNTGAIGAAVAWHRFEIALILSLINFLTLYFGQSVKSQINGKSNGE
ncbi:MAG: MgtC/SapB family protein [Verrucomicrobiae bacterium]|nr:MgtC/SapB family protein [Verrucomicrobiae bacterium]